MPEWSGDKDALEISASGHSFREIILARMGFFEGSDVVSNCPVSNPLKAAWLFLPSCVGVQLPGLFRGADEKSSQDTRPPSSHQGQEIY